MNTQLTEIMRLITNLIRTGIVTEVDRDGWLCRVKTGDLETNWINWLKYLAGTNLDKNNVLDLYVFISFIYVPDCVQKNTTFIS